MERSTKSRKRLALGRGQNRSLRRQRTMRNKTRKGGACPCNMRAGGRKTLRRRQSLRRQRGGDASMSGWSAFWNRPWLSTVPENSAQQVGLRWYGEQPPVSLYPTVHNYKLLSEHDPIMNNYSRGALTRLA